MRDRLIKLLEVKSIVTLTLVFVASYGFVTGKISSELFATWVSIVLAFYFTRKLNG